MAKQLRPLDARVIVEKRKAKEQTEGGIILPDSINDQKQTSQGVVLSVGPGSRNMNDGEPMSMDIKVGDTVIYQKFTGIEMEYDNKEVVIVPERDIIAVEEEC
jgi:chaperonin GroES|tara:strand:+ start:157 stop:465 length:309 start_codon:yes stop_codon:yes gene_type:complete